VVPRGCGALVLRGWERFDFGSISISRELAATNGGYMTEHLDLLETEAKSALEAAADERHSLLGEPLPGP